MQLILKEWRIKLYLIGIVADFFYMEICIYPPFIHSVIDL